MKAAIDLILGVPSSLCTSPTEPLLFRWIARRGPILCSAQASVNGNSDTCRKHMMCPVVVANEMSGLKGRVGVGSHPHWRLKVDAVISGPSFGAGNEDQRSHHTGHQRKDQLDSGRRDSGDVGPAVASVAEKLGQVRLRWTIRPQDPTAESQASADGGCGAGVEIVSGEILRPERQALRREAAS